MLMMLAVWGPPERGHRADAHDAGPFRAHWKGAIELMLMMLHDAGPFQTYRKWAIELMLMMLACLGPTGRAIELMLMMLACLGPTGQGPSS